LDGIARSVLLFVLREHFGALQAKDHWNCGRDSSGYCPLSWHGAFRENRHNDIGRDSVSDFGLAPATLPWQFFATAMSEAATVHSQCQLCWVNLFRAFKSQSIAGVVSFVELRIHWYLAALMHGSL